MDPNISRIPKFKSKLPQLKRPAATKKVHIEEPASFGQIEDPGPSTTKRLKLGPQNEQIKRLRVKVANARRSVAKAHIFQTKQKVVKTFQTAQRTVPVKALHTSSRTVPPLKANKKLTNVATSLYTSSKTAPLKANKKLSSFATSQKPMRPNTVTSSRITVSKPKAAVYTRVKSLECKSEPRISLQSTLPPSGSTLQPPKKPKRKAWDVKGQLDDAKEQVEFFKKAVKKYESDLVRFANVAEQIEEMDEQKMKERKDFAKKERTLQQELREACDQIEAHEYKLDEFENKLNTSEKERKKIKEEFSREIKKIKEEFSESKKQCEELETDVKSLKTEGRINSEKLKSMTERASNLQEETEKQKEEIKMKTEDIEKKTNELYAMEEDRRKLLNLVQELKGNIRVYCRVRPLLSSEADEADNPDHIEFDEDDKSLKIHEGNKNLPFQFDRVFDMESTQKQIFDDVSQLIQSALDGYNVCIFAYGQTGSGKTYTMEGTSEQMGIIPRAIELIFEKSDYLAKFGWKFKLSVQQVQIYMETLMDLLPKSSTEKLEIKTVSESNRQKIWVKNLSEHGISSFEEVIKLMEFAKKKRITASTNLNDVSSRSHSVFILKIKAHNETTGEKNESALNLVDLAGSERVSAAGSSGTRLKEAQKINASLSELCNVIAALANKKTHIPYRNSKLTLLLRDSLGGNSKTLMLVNVNPRKSSTSETINTLRFATTVNQCNIGSARKNIKF